MSKVSWYKQRLKALLFKARFADKVEEIKPVRNRPSFLVSRCLGLTDRKSSQLSANRKRQTSHNRWACVCVLFDWRRILENPHSCQELIWDFGANGTIFVTANVVRSSPRSFEQNRDCSQSNTLVFATTFLQDLESVLDASEELRRSPKLQKILEVWRWPAFTSVVWKEPNNYCTDREDWL